MMRFWVCLAVLCGSLPAFAADDSWTSCKTDADCVVVGSVCPNFYWAINRAYVFENAARNASERGTVDCAASFQSRPQSAACKEGQCQAPQNKPLRSASETAQ